MPKRTLKRKRRITKSYFDLFFKKNKLLLYKTASISASNSQELEEGISVAHEALLYVMIHFDHKKFSQVRKGSFTSFLHNRIHGVSRNLHKKNRRLSQFELLENNIIKYNDKTELKILIKELLSILPRDEKSAIIDSCLNNMTLKEIAMKMNVSTCKINHLKKRGLAKLNRIFYGEE